MPPDGPESARERGHPESVSERAAVGQRAGGLYPPGDGGGEAPERSGGEGGGRSSSVFRGPGAALGCTPGRPAQWASGPVLVASASAV